MKSELIDYEAALAETEDPTAAAILVLAERVNKLGFDTNESGSGALGYIGTRLDQLIAAVWGVAKSIGDVAL